MELLGNLIWLIFGGFLIGLGYILGGIGLCLTIIGIPFGLKAIRMGLASFTPFGKVSTPRASGGGCLPTAFNIIWLILFGWEIALAHLLSGIILFITIIGIPFARQHFKLVPVALMPFSYSLDAVHES